MSDNNNTQDAQALTLEDLEAAYAAMRAKIAQARADESTRLTQALHETIALVAEDIVEHTQEKEYDKSAAYTQTWKGYSHNGHEVTLADGRKVTVSVTVTTRKAVRAPKASK